MRTPTGPAAFYVGDNVAPMPRTDDGFVTVGDLGWLDEDGFLFLADRRVDMIVTGAANVFPAEVESALSEHPGVADVVVIGLRDPEWGRRVHAIVQPATGEDPLDAEQVIPSPRSAWRPTRCPRRSSSSTSIAPQRRHEAQPRRPGGRAGWARARHRGRQRPRRWERSGSRDHLRVHLTTPLEASHPAGVATTRLVSTPMPSTSISTRSPGCTSGGAGGVPRVITSPGRRLKKPDR